MLGLNQGASSEQIKRAYHSLSLRYHPDKDKTVPIHLSTARFQRIKAAYDLLSDLPRRKALAKTVISAPFRPNVVGEVRRKQKASPKAKEKKAKKTKAKEAKPTRVSQSVNSSSQEALVILDSDEEGAEVSIVSISGKAKRKKQDEETARWAFCTRNVYTHGILDTHAHTHTHTQRHTYTHTHTSTHTRTRTQSIYSASIYDIHISDVYCICFFLSTAFLHFCHAFHYPLPSGFLVFVISFLLASWHFIDHVAFLKAYVAPRAFSWLCSLLFCIPLLLLLLLLLQHFSYVQSL